MEPVKVSSTARIPAAVVFLAICSALPQSACIVDVKYDDVRFACSDGVCPSGYNCQQGVCISTDELSDASAIDASANFAVDATALASCDASFSAATGYVLCTEEADRCAFNVQLNGTSCNDACTALGSTCITAQDNEGELLCQALAEETCDVTRNNEICVCAKIAPAP